MQSNEKPDGKMSVRAPKRVIRQIDDFRMTYYQNGGTVLTRSTAILCLIEDGLAAQEKAEPRPA